MKPKPESIRDDEVVLPTSILKFLIQWEEASMQYIPIEKATVIMTLAKPVTREGGMVLAGAGLKLTEAMLERLKGSGVTHITVEGHPVAGIEEDGLDLAALRDRLDHLFRKYKQNPLMWVLRNMIAQYLEKRIGAQLPEDPSNPQSPAQVEQ